MDIEEERPQFHKEVITARKLIREIRNEQKFKSMMEQVKIIAKCSKKQEKIILKAF